LAAWLLAAVRCFFLLAPLAYGFTPLTADEVDQRRLRESWDLIVHKP